MARKTLVIGIGNPILGDDGVGIAVVRRLKALRHADAELAFMELHTTGLDIIEAITGYDKVIFVDAIMTRDGEPGDIHRLDAERFEQTIRYSVHDVDLPTTLKMARELGIRLPKDILVFGIEVEAVDTFKEGLSKAVEASVPEVIEQILRELPAWPKSVK